MAMQNKRRFSYTRLVFLIIVIAFILQISTSIEARYASKQQKNDLEKLHYNDKELLESKCAAENDSIQNNQNNKEIKSTVPGAAPDFLDTPEKDSNLFQAFRSPAFIKAISRFFSRLTPGQGGIIWLSIIIIVIIAFDFKKLKSRRNADLILFMVLSFLFIDLTRFGGYWSLKSNSAQKSPALFFTHLN
jgi:hypothetical protein